MIAFISTVDGSTMRDDLIVSHQVDICSQRSFQLKLLKMTKNIVLDTCSNKVGSIALLVL